jgi:ABC-type transport system involved in multi-copper enzyme maturation permease subunit
MLRTTYLGILWILGLTAWQATVGWSQTATLGDNARFGLVLFQLFTFVQLTLLLFFSALSAAGTIAQEKDRRTFVLLLLTDLRNYEIVLGKLFGSLLQIGLLLMAMVPVFAIMLLLGGIGAEQVVQAIVILAATGMAAGSLGGLIALWREKTFQILALTVLSLVLYLCLVRGLAVVPVLASWLGMSVSPALIADGQRWLDPFQAWISIFDPRTATGSELAPAYGYAGTMVFLTFLLNLIGVVRLRVWNPSGEPIMQREQPGDVEAEEKDRLKAHAAPGKVRHVWANPILWREIRTRAYGRRAFIVKLAYFLVLGLICYYALAPVVSGERTDFAAAQGLVPVGILSLLLVSAQAVTAITSERDTGALDLLLVTDLTPKEFIFGKIGGICFNTLEYLIVPLILAGVYASYGYLAHPPAAHPEMLGSMNAESLFSINSALLLLLAFVMVLGMHVALRIAVSRLAIIHTLGTVFFLSVGTLVCIYIILINGRFEYQWASFGFFIIAGIGGLWWVLCGDRPSTALTIASWACPFVVFYTVTNIIVGKPGSEESTDPLVPLFFLSLAFGFTVAAMLVPLISEFDVALGRTTDQGE